MTNLVICYPEITAPGVADHYESNDTNARVAKLSAGELSNEYAQDTRGTDDLTVNWDAQSSKPVNYFGILNAKTLQDGGCDTLVLRSGSVSAFSPTEIAGLQLWLDAGRGVTKDGSNLVSQWSDLSGQGNHATASGSDRPTWVSHNSGRNYHSSILFSGSQHLKADSAATAFSGNDIPYTLINVTKLDSTAFDQSVLGLGNSADGDSAAIHLPSTAAGARQFFRRSDDGTTINRIFGTATTNYEVILWKFNGTEIEVFLNGLSIYGPIGANVNTNTLNRLTIGAWRSTGSANTFLRGSITEIAMYDSALSGADLTKIHDYFTAKHITAPKYQTLTLNSDTLTGRKGKHVFEALASSSARHWWVTLGTETTSRYRHSKHLIGNYLDLGRDPVWGRRAEVIGDFYQDKRRKYRYTLTWEGLTKDKAQEFETNIGEKADSTVFALATVDGYDPTLLDDEIVPVYLQSYDVVATAHNTYTLETEWVEAL